MSVYEGQVPNPFPLPNSSPGTIKFGTGKSVLLNIFLHTTMNLVLEQNYWDALMKGLFELIKFVFAIKKQ
jgi:hypothetical protein